MITCPICDEAWPEEPMRCLCGYDFETRDPTRAVEVLRARLRGATRLGRAGIGLIVSVPLTVLATWYWIPPILGLLAAPLELGLGVLFTTMGILRGHRDRKSLAVARARLQLPTARVIPR